MRLNFNKKNRLKMRLFCPTHRWMSKKNAENIIQIDMICVYCLNLWCFVAKLQPGSRRSRPLTLSCLFQPHFISQPFLSQNKESIWPISVLFLSFVCLFARFGHCILKMNANKRNAMFLGVFFSLLNATLILIDQLE